MIWDVKNSKGMVLVDRLGTVMTTAYEFNDLTCEVKFFVYGMKDGDRHFVLDGEAVARGSAIIRGARMVPKLTAPAVPETPPAQIKPKKERKKRAKPSAEVT